VNAWLSLAAGVAVAAAGAAVIGFFCVRTTGIPFLMLTLAFSQLVFSVALKWRDDVTGRSDGMAIAEKPALFGFELSDSLAMYFVALVFFLLSYWGLRACSTAARARLRRHPREQAAHAGDRLSRAPTSSCPSPSPVRSRVWRRALCHLQQLHLARRHLLDLVRRHIDHDHAGRRRRADRARDRRRRVPLMKNVVSSYSEHWLAIIGVIFICCVMFFPGGIWGTLRQIRLRRRKP
jgi:branched-chain amino acid transport system permease protein